MKYAFYKSLALHLVVLLAFLIDVPAFWRKDLVIEQVPIIVDLNDVKISEMTNLPPKAKFGDEDKEASKIKRKIEEKNYTQDKEEEVEQIEEKDSKTVEESVDEKPVEPKQDFLVAPQPKKPDAPKKIAKPMPQPKKPKRPEVKKKPQPKPKPEKGAPQLANPLKSLLASVDALEKDIGETDQEATIKEGTNVNNMGVAGGVGGSYFSELSITEADAIAGRLRQCWNLDPGAMGIEDMIVEIRAYLNQDGSVRKVDILDESRYNSDTHFRSVADSARRAVFICAPYKIFAEKYSDKYDMWKTMLLRFNPLNGAIN